MARTRAARPGRPATPAPVVAWPYVAVIALAGLFAYGNSFSGPFVFDDFGSIVRNAQIRDLSDIRQLLTTAPDTPVAGRPIANVSFAISYALGGLNVAGYHAANLGLHLACAWLLFGLIRRTLDLAGMREVFGWRSIDLAGAVVFLWTVHPLNSEVVDYLTQRTESLMAACYLLTMYASLRSIEPGQRRGGLWRAVAIVSCAVGLGVKETIVTAPVVVVLFDRAFVFDSLAAAFRSRWRFYACLAATWIIPVILVSGQGQTVSAGFNTAQTTPWTYFLNQTQLLVHYLRLTVWPQALVFYYGWARPVAIVDVWPYALLLSALFVVAAIALVQRPRVGFLGAWAFITLAPASSFVPVATEVGAERRMYLPLMALITLAVIGAAYIWNRTAKASRAQPRWAGAAVVSALTVALATGTILRNHDYRSALILAQTSLDRWPNPNAERLVGMELSAAGRHDEAIAHLRQVVNGSPPARYYLGSELLATGQYDEAIAALEQFMRDEPKLATRASHMMIARAYLAKQEVPKAIDEFTRILAAAPSDAGVHGLLADALAAERRFDEAVPHYQVFVAANPGDGNGWTGLGIALASSGKTIEAVSAFQNAVATDPDNPHFRENLARAQEQARIKR